MGLCENVEEQGLQWQFDLACDNEGVISVIDPLLDTEAKAEERAKSEFLKNSYLKSTIRFSSYLTDFVLNETINVGGAPYLVKGINTQIDRVREVSVITAIRYDI